MDFSVQVFNFILQRAIEKMWSKLKAYFRKSKLRSVELLQEAIPKAFSTITTSDALGWFSASGY
jgi:hypothetical protein